MTRSISAWIRESRFAFRGLRRSPGFTTVSILTLALGIASALSIFTLIDRIILDPLPYPENDRLVDLRNLVPGVGPDARWAVSLAQYEYFTEHSNTLESLGLYRFLGASIQTPEGPQRAYGWRATHEVLPLIGAEAQLGRLIRQEDELRSAPKVVVLSNDFWRTHFGSDPGVIGSTISINDVTHEIVGVLTGSPNTPIGPAGVSTQLWVAVETPPEQFFNSHVFIGVARLAEGIDLETASRELTGFHGALVQTYPNVYSESFFERTGFETVALSMKDEVLGTSGRNLGIYFGAVAIVLLIAIGNVANLFLVRAESRGRELGVREALGAGRAHVGQFLLAEGMIVSIIATGVGLLLATWVVSLIATLGPSNLPRMNEVTVDGTTLLFGFALALVVGFALAAYPMFRGSRLADVGSGSSRSEAPGHQRFRSGMVVVQVALALTLVVGAGLLLESVDQIRSIDTGFEDEGVLTAEIYLSAERYGSDIEVWSTHRQILERVRSLPGVSLAGMTQSLPLSGGFGCTVQAFEDQRVYEVLNEADLTTCAGQILTAPGFFEAMEIPLVSGRLLSEADNDGQTGAVVVSETFAERFWPGDDPLGKGVGPNGNAGEPWYRVVGVVGDIKAGSPDGENANAIYYPLVEIENGGVSLGRNFGRTIRLVVKTDLADPISLTPAVIAAVREVDPSVPVANAMSMTDRYQLSISRFTFNASMLLIAAVMALVLAAVGLYGVISYVVTRRTREIGMRIAIGAHPNDVQRLFVGRSARLVGLGLAIGVGVSLGVGRVLEGLLYGVEPTNLLSFGAAGVILSAVSLLATWLPARRASRIAPAEVLRAQ